VVILFDQFHLPEDIFEIIFATEQQVVVGRLLINQIKLLGGSMDKTEMSVFATKLHEGTLIDVEEEVGPVTRTKQIKVSYNKRQFYDRILTPMKSMGLIDYDLYKKRYILSDRFQKVLSNIGVMWLKEFKAPAKQ